METEISSEVLWQILVARDCNLAEARSRIREQDEHIDEVQGELNERIGNLRNQLQYCQELRYQEHLELSSTLKSKQAKLEGLEQVRREEVIDLTSRLNTSQARAENLLEQLRDLQKQFKRIQGLRREENLQYASHVQNLQTQLGDSQSERSQLQEELVTANTRVHSLQEELDDCQNRLRRVRDRTEISKKRQRSKITQLERQVQERQAELIHCQTQMVAMESSKFWKMRKLWHRFKQSVNLIQD